MRLRLLGGGLGDGLRLGLGLGLLGHGLGLIGHGLGLLDDRLGLFGRRCGLGLVRHGLGLGLLRHGLGLGLLRHALGLGRGRLDRLRRGFLKLLEGDERRGGWDSGLRLGLGLGHDRVRGERRLLQARGKRGLVEERRRLRGCGRRRGGLLGGGRNGGRHLRHRRDRDRSLRGRRRSLNRGRRRCVVIRRRSVGQRHGQIAGGRFGRELFELRGLALVFVVVFVLEVVCVDVDPGSRLRIDLDALLGEEAADAAHEPLALAQDDGVRAQFGPDSGNQLLDCAPAVGAHAVRISSRRR